MHILYTALRLQALALKREKEIEEAHERAALSVLQYGGEKQMKVGDIVTRKPHVSADLGSSTADNRWPQGLCLVVEVTEDRLFAYRSLHPDGSINFFSNTCTGELQQDYVVLHPGKLADIVAENQKRIAALNPPTITAYPPTTITTEAISISIQTVKGRRILIREESPEGFTVIFLDSPKPQ